MADTPKQAADKLTRMAKDYNPPALQKALLGRAKVLMISDARLNFRNSSTPDEIPWPKLRFPRVISHGADKPLLDFGILQASVVGEGKGKANHISTITADSLEIGTNRVGASLHNAGGTVTPKKAKALAIPLTKEAKRSGGPKRFPGKLVMLWRKGAKSGVLAQVTRTKVSKQEKTLRKQTKKYTEKERQYLDRIKKLQQQAKRKPSSAAAITAKIESVYEKLRAYQKTIAGKVRTREDIEAKRKAGGIIAQFALVKSVTIPARQFIGFGKRLMGKLETMFTETIADWWAGKLPSQKGNKP